MRVKKYGFLFRHQHATVGTVVHTLVIVIVLIASCADACPRRRSGSSSPKPPPKVPKPPLKRPTPNTTDTSALTNTTMSVTKQPTDTTVKSSESQFNFCVSTSIKNITNKTVREHLNNLVVSGNLSRLFINATETNIFLKQQRSTSDNCSNVRGHSIKIRKTTLSGDDRYKFDMRQLDEERATRHCNKFQLGDCYRLLQEDETSNQENITTPTVVTPVQTKTTKSEEKGTVAAGRSDDGVSSTAIAIPIAVVVFIVVAVIIVALWFKHRRSEGKGDKENKGQVSVDLDCVAGPVNGDVYTVVNPSTAEKKKKGKNDSSDMIYTELAEVKPEKSEENKPPEAEQVEYADITHVLRNDHADTAYENVALQTGNSEVYSNVIELKSKDT